MDAFPAAVSSVKNDSVQGAICGTTALGSDSFLKLSFSMPRVVKRLTQQAVDPGPSRRDVAPPQFVTPQLSLSVETPPSGSQWVHEIKLDGYRMAARIDNGRAQLLTRTGLDWTGKYPSIAEALTNLNAKTAYLDGELCGVDDAGLPSFAQTQAATDGARSATHLLCLRSPASWRLGRFEPPVDRAQGASRALGDRQTRPSIQRA
jgi:hypothetical protein